MKWYEKIVVGLADAMLAGAAAGAIETLRLWFGSDRAPPGASGMLQIAVATIGLSMLGAAVIGPPLLLLSAGIRRTRWFDGWWSGMRAGGGDRSVALLRSLLAVIAVLVVAVFGFYVAVKSFGRFNAPGAVGILHAAAAVLAALVATLGALAVEQVLSPRLRRWSWLERITTGWAGWGALGVAVVAVAVGAVLFLRKAAPAYDFRPVLTLVGFLAALGTLRLLGAARRLPRIGQGIAAGACVALAIISLATIGSWPVARQAIASNGISSASVLRMLWRLSDGDGDGYPGRFGGGDCDDGNPNVHPGAAEVIDNGIDENCQGGDLSSEAFGPRARVQATSFAGAPKHNVILVSIDAVRADHLGVYGYERPTTPVLDELAAKSAVFDWAITPAPTTRRAIPGMMTSRYASTLSLRESDKDWPPRLIRGHHVLLGELFKQAGYDTHAVMCCTTLFDKATGVAIGFDTVDSSAVAKYKKSYYNGDELAAKAAEFIVGRSPDAKPFFLWIHFIDPHNPYKQLPGAPEFGSKPIDRYDSEIAFVDGHVGTVLGALRDADVADKTVIAVTSDHGDEFQEHGHEYHALTAYNEVVRVPLIVHYPGAAKRRVGPPVSMIDVGPTLLDLVGVDTPPGKNGRSLARSVRDGAPPPDRTVLSEVISDRNVHRNLKAAFYGSWKIIWDLDANAYELFSLVDDPGDLRDVGDDNSEVLDDMKRRLHEAVDSELTLLPDDVKRRAPKQPKPKQSTPKQPKPKKASAP